MAYLILSWFNHLPQNFVREPLLGVNRDPLPTGICLCSPVVVLATVEKAATAASIKEAFRRKERLLREKVSLSNLWFMMLPTF
jgi:hypothetical protein